MHEPVDLPHSEYRDWGGGGTGMNFAHTVMAPSRAGLATTGFETLRWVAKLDRLDPITQVPSAVFRDNLGTWPLLGQADSARSGCSPLEDC